MAGSPGPAAQPLAHWTGSARVGPASRASPSRGLLPCLRTEWSAPSPGSRGPFPDACRRDVLPCGPSCWRVWPRQGRAQSLEGHGSALHADWPRPEWSWTRPSLEPWSHLGEQDRKWPAHETQYPGPGGGRGRTGGRVEYTAVLAHGCPCSSTEWILLPSTWGGCESKRSGSGVWSHRQAAAPGPAPSWAQAVHLCCGRIRAQHPN